MTILKTIDILTNTIQELKTKKDKDDCAYLIHCIIDQGMTEENKKAVVQYKIMGKAHYFMNVNN